MAKFEHKFFYIVSERHNGEFNFTLRPKSKWHWYAFLIITSAEVLFKYVKGIVRGVGKNGSK